MSSGKRLTTTSSNRLPSLKASDGSDLNFTEIKVTLDATRNGNSITPVPNSARQELFARPTAGANPVIAATRTGSGNWTFARDQSGNYILSDVARRDLTNSSTQLSRNVNNSVSTTARNASFVDGSTTFSLNESQANEAIRGTRAPSTETGAAAGEGQTQESSPATVEEVTMFERPATIDYGIMKYPLDLDNVPRDYLRIDLLEYKKSGLRGADGSLATSRIDDRITQIKGTAFLPIQSGIVDNCSVDWGQGELNPLTAQFAAAAYSTISAAEGGLGPAISVLGSTLSSVLEKFGDASPELRAMLINYYTQAAVSTPGLLSRTIGGAINNNLELLFNGPTLRSFTFTFRLTPRQSGEAAEIKKMVRMFKTEMHPALSPAELFLLTPNVFKLSYKQFFTDKQVPNNDHQYLNRIKICALKDFSVNYTPDGSYMTYAQDGSMTSYELNMTFAEISPIYKQDYTESEEGQRGMGW